MSSSHIPPIHCLNALRAVARHQSISEAANKLCVTHSAISQNIKQLEEMLGCKLTKKVGRNVQLTEVAKQYIDDISPHIEALEFNSLKVKTRSQVNRLTIKMVSTLALRWFVPKLKDLKHQFPELDLKLLTCERSDQFEMTADVDVSVVFCSSQQLKSLEQNWYTTKIANSQLVMVTAESVKTVKDALTNNVAVYSLSPLRRKDWSIWCKQMDVIEPVPQQRLELENSAQALEAVSAKAGVLVTQKLFVQPMLELNHLYQVGELCTEEDWAYYFCCRQPQTANEQRKHALIKELIECLL